MNRLKLAMIILCLTLMALAVPSGMNADEWDKKTNVTFSQPVEIPGVGAQVLPAGTYVFKLLNSSSDRNIVQIFNQDQTHLFATILAIPNYRMHATDKTVITFREGLPGTPEAIRVWFYPGNNWGQEFVYPMNRAIELAKVTREPVLAMPAALAADIVKPVKSVDDPPVAALKVAPITAVEPTGKEIAVAEVVGTPPVQTAAVQAPSTKHFPRTASPLPLLGLIGLLALAAGVTLSAIRKPFA